MSCFPNKQGGGATSSPLTIYEFLIDQTTDDPASMISYTGANKDFIPAKMNFATGKFDYGSWKNTWIFNKFKPCMLHADGTVAYYLNPHNLTQKITGGDAMPDLTSTEHDMNAMVEVGQIWIKEEFIDDDHFHIYLSPTKQDGYDCWSHYNINNKLVDKLYYAMYRGSLDSNEKMRSLSRKMPATYIHYNTMRQDVQNNGSGWDIEEWSFRRLMQYVCLLLGKNTNGQSVFGMGVESIDEESGSDESLTPLMTGGNEEYGIFFGKTSLDNHVCILGIEDFWGNTYSFGLGYIITSDPNNNNIYVKMTPGNIDGTSGTDYDFDISHYSQAGKINLAPDVHTMLFITKMKLVPRKGLLISELQKENTNNHYYCDGVYLFSENDPSYTNGGYVCFGSAYANYYNQGGIFTFSCNRSSQSNKHHHIGVVPVFKNPN